MSYIHKRQGSYMHNYISLSCVYCFNERLPTNGSTQNIKNFNSYQPLSSFCHIFLKTDRVTSHQLLIYRHSDSKSQKLKTR